MPTDKQVLRELAERAEEATGPDRELDCAVAKAFGLADQRTQLAPQGFGYVDRNQWAVVNVPRYTASLDAAMTLVPEGWRWTVDNDAVEGGGAYVWHRVLIEYEGRAATPALALTAAALRARSQENSNGD